MTEPNMPKTRTRPATEEEGLRRVMGVTITRTEAKRVDAALRYMILKTSVGPEAKALALVGESGSGKSTLISQLIRRNQTLGRGAGTPHRIVIAQVPGPCTLAGLAVEICHAAGFAYGGSTFKSDVAWAAARRSLAAHGIRYLVLDEFQNAFEAANAVEQDKVRNAMRKLLVDGEWRVGLILVGQPSIAPFLTKDPSLRRRTAFVSLPTLSPRSASAFVKAIDAIVRSVGLHIAEGEATDIAARVLHASLYQFGTAVDLTRDAALTALMAEGAVTSVTTSHFADAFSMRTGNFPQANPFLVSDWWDVDCSSVIATGVTSPDTSASGDQVSR